MNQEERMAQLESLVTQLMDWKRAREAQAIPYPLDDASRNVINASRVIGQGGTSLTKTYNVSGGAGGSITGPQAYVATILIRLDNGNVYEVPYLAINP